MSEPNKEARLHLALQAYRENPKKGIRPLATHYRVSESTLRKRVNGVTPRSELRQAMHKLTKTEEEVILQRVLDLDARGFSPRISSIEEMANLILESRGAGRVGIHWARRFIKRQPDLVTRLNRVYDYQRALCEDPDIIQAWFRLVHNMRAKYSIDDRDIYNFDETGFMIRVIRPSMIVTYKDREGRRKAIQLGNREWATAVICISRLGDILSPFLIL